MSTSLQHYREAFERFNAQRPDAEHALRSAALERFLAAGFPGKRLEEWRYTDLATLSQQAFMPAPADTAGPGISAYFLDGCDRLVFVDGRLDAALSASALAPAVLCERPGVPPAADERGAIVALNQAFATSGFALRVPAGVALARPVQVLCVTLAAAPDRMSHLAHSIELASGAAATVIVQHLGLGAAAHFATHTLEVAIGDGARLALYRAQEEGPGTSHLFRCDARVGRDAWLTAGNVDLGGGLVRNDWNIDLAARGAGVTLDGLYAPAGSTHVDNHTRIDHRCPHGTSRETFRGIVGDKARAVFNGRIVVHPGAQKTDSEQRVANLLLSNTAEVNAKPELEIHADDVKCAHGATFGQLDDNAIFYLRSRGLPPELARALLTYTFAFEILGRIEPPALRRLLERAFLERLPLGLELERLL